MTVEELHPLVQRAQGMSEWSVSNWIVVGQIFDEMVIQISRAAIVPHAFSASVMGKGIGTVATPILK